MNIRVEISIVIALAGAMAGMRAEAESPRCTAGMRAEAESPGCAARLSVIHAIKMIRLPGGKFLMGDSRIEDQQGYPQHIVMIKPFKIAATDVTFDQYDRYAKATSRPLPQDEGRGRGNNPVVNVSWQDMQGFIAWLNEGTNRHFRLPSEAEWEYAARGGTMTAFYWGDKMIANVANTGDKPGAKPTPVGSFPPNPFGLYDMAGNVAQAVEDCRHPTYNGAPTNGSAWVDASCDSRIVRGGNYGDLSLGVRVTARAAVGESFLSMALGFRLAEDIVSQRQK